MQENNNSEIDDNESEVLLNIGGEIDKTSVTLRFFGDELEPNELTEKLNFQPTYAHRKGDIVPNKFKPHIVKTGTWLLAGEKEGERDLEKQILDLFEKLPGDLEIWKDLTKRFEADIYCGAWLKGWNRDVYFSPQVLKQISDKGLHLGMAIYCEGDQEEKE